MITFIKNIWFRKSAKKISDVVAAVDEHVTNCELADSYQPRKKEITDSQAITLLKKSNAHISFNNDLQIWECRDITISAHGYSFNEAVLDFVSRSKLKY